MYGTVTPSVDTFVAVGTSDHPFDQHDETTDEGNAQSIRGRR